MSGLSGSMYAGRRLQLDTRPTKRFNDGLASVGQLTALSDKIIHYSANMVCKIKNDVGATDNSAHGINVTYADTRDLPLLPNPSDYQVGLVRASVTTNNIPLFCALPSKLVTENKNRVWEMTAQPGLAFTWTGPAYSVNNNVEEAGVAGGGVYPQHERMNCAWPTFGAFYTYARMTAPFATNTQLNKFIPSYVPLNDPSIGGSPNPDTTIATACERLSSILSLAFFNATYGQGGFAGNNIVVSTSSGGGATDSTTSSQFFTFQNQNTELTFYLDFTIPDIAAASSSTRVPKAAILQTCKLLGFAPNTVFAIGPGATVTAPRAFQLAFRTTLNLYCYKTARWAPEDRSTRFPSEGSVQTGEASTQTYFDCSSYQHVLNRCINPTFQRIIWDEFDEAAPLLEQCLTRQLRSSLIANCSATPWLPNVLYAARDGVTYNGRAYIAIAPALGGSPPPGNNLWMDVGASVRSTYELGRRYYIGDIVTFPSATPGRSWLYIVTSAAGAGGTTLTPTVPASGETNIWDLADQTYGYFNTVSPSSTLLYWNIPSIGTAAPTITYSETTKCFSMVLDSYGFGGTPSLNIEDGYEGVNSDPQTIQQLSVLDVYNSTLNDVARDSWGLTGTMPVATASLAYQTARGPFIVYDERFVVEADDYFNQLFGNWPSIKLTYTEPGNSSTNAGLTTSYVRYMFQVENAGLAVPLPLPNVIPTVVTSGSWLPYGRVAGNQAYFYTFSQDYSSAGLMWSPVDCIVVKTGRIPLVDDQVIPPNIVAAVLPIDSSSARNRILAEISTPGYQETEYRNEIVYEPFNIIYQDMNASDVFKTFDFAMFLRMKTTQQERPLSLSNGGSVNLRFEFILKQF